jgi:predicted alpha/beta-hydrolase family hydrolase
MSSTARAPPADISTLVDVGVPVDSYNFDFLLGVRTPGLILHETRDEFGSAVRVTELDDSLAEPKQIHRV